MFLIQIKNKTVPHPNVPLKHAFWVALGCRVEGSETLKHVVLRKISEEAGRPKEEIEPRSRLWYGEDTCLKEQFSLQNPMWIISV